MSKHTFYRNNDAYIMATGKAPKGMKGALAIVWEGSITDLEETVKSVGDLQAMESIEPDDVPSKWWAAFVKASKTLKERKPESKPESKAGAKAGGKESEPAHEVETIKPWEPVPVLILLFWLGVLWLTSSL